MIPLRNLHNSLVISSIEFKTNRRPDDRNSNQDEKPNKTKLVLDILIFIAFLIAMEPRSSGITIHEWLATSLIAVLVVHLLLSWDWIT